MAKRLDIIGKCRVLVKEDGKILNKFNALVPVGSANMIASFLASNSPAVTSQALDTMVLENSSEAPLTATMFTSLANIPLDNVDHTVGPLTVTSDTTLTPTTSVGTAALSVFTVGIPAGFFPAGPQNWAGIGMLTSTTSNVFSRVVFDTPIAVTNITALTIEYTYVVVPSGV